MAYYGAGWGHSLLQGRGRIVCTVTLACAGEASPCRWPFVRSFRSPREALEAQVIRDRRMSAAN